MKNSLTIEEIAMICHAANKELCHLQEDKSQTLWELTQPHVRKSVVDGVKYHLENPDATPENSHENWLKFKESEGGWKYAEEKNLLKKEHPCFRPYAELPASQKMKDHIFRAIVHSLAPFLEK